MYSTVLFLQGCYNSTVIHAEYLYWKNVFLQPARCANQIEEVCKEIEKTINQTIQNTLNTLEKDCEKIADLVDEKLRNDSWVVYDVFYHFIHHVGSLNTATAPCSLLLKMFHRREVCDSASKNADDVNQCFLN